jgi:hypothetical protein
MSTFKFATFVVEFMTNGAVPVVTDDVNCPFNVNVAPVNVVFPALPIVPVVMILSAPVSILPNPLVIDPLLSAPTAVSDELTTLLPRVVAESTSVPLIL